MKNTIDTAFKPAFSIIEMLISLSLGAILMAAIYQITIQLNFAISQDRADVVQEIKEIGEFKNLIHLFNNAGLHEENKNPVNAGSDNKKVIVMFNGSNECFGRAYNDSSDAIKRYLIEKSDGGINSIYCLENESEKPSNSKIIIQDAQIESISYFISESTTNKYWLSSPSSEHMGLINGIYFRYSKDSKTYGLFSAFNTRN